jgi:hypothetical protein
MVLEVEVKKDDSCISGYAKVNGKSRRVFQVYHSRPGMPDVEFAMAYAEVLKEKIMEAPYEPK